MVKSTNEREDYPRSAYWYPGRIGVEYYSEDGRLAESSEWRGPPWTINRSLRELCQIPGNTFFVAAEENGRVICLSTPIGSSQLDHEQFFDIGAFVSNINQIRRTDPQSFHEAELGFSPDMSAGVPETNRARNQGRYYYPNGPADAHTEDLTRKSRKRPRAVSRQSGMTARQSRISMVTVEPSKGIRISDSEAVYAFYDHSLRFCQQTACKIIAKAWVKAVAPKKQSTHPYTKGDTSRPDWWPRTYCKYGEDSYKEMRHKEPDHLGKDERVYLLCHILRMIVEPEHKRHPALRKVNLNLATLESVTFEHLSSFFGDKNSPANKSKKPLLKDVFKVARQEARFKDHEINGMTEVFVTSVGNRDAGNESESDDEGDIDQKFTPATSVSSSVEPNRPQIMMSQVPVNQHNETGQFQGHNFHENIPFRPAHYPHSEFESEMPDRPNFVETPVVGNQPPNYGPNQLGLPELYPSPQGTSRRSSVFNSPTEYGSPATPVGYSSWPTSNGPSSLYGFPPQPPNVQAFGQLTQGPPYAAQPIDGLPRQAPDPQHGDMFSSRTVGQCPVPTQTGYPSYVTESLMGSNVKSEAGHHPSIH
ncbi:hypothetical protein F4678DRAFT_456494 [Xylaria arbuscula]|nr:hypothetical protein F4678DRAFT_456494 [Xylaria arbuscula]